MANSAALPCRPEAGTTPRLGLARPSLLARLVASLWLLGTLGVAQGQTPTAPVDAAPPKNPRANSEQTTTAGGTSSQTGSGTQSAEFPPELVHFQPAERNPVFAAAGPGTWEVKIRERGWILKEGDRWHLWYSGYDGTRVNRVRLGYATSDDGLIWHRHPDNPVDSDDWIEDPTVVREGDTLYLFAEGRDDQPHWFTSTDGVRWTRRGGLDVRRTDGRPVESGPLGTPTVIRTAAGWNLLYERRDAGVWLARSTDLKQWTNVRDEPVLTRDPAGPDAVMIAMNQVIVHGGKYYAFYHGTRTPQRPRLWTTNIAVSDDLVTWRKYAGNPLRPEAENKSSGQVVFDGQRFRLYTMHERVDVHWSVPVAR